MENNKFNAAFSVKTIHLDTNWSSINFFISCLLYIRVYQYTMNNFYHKVLLVTDDKNKIKALHGP